jgi:transcriptional regulator with XRE-family HTH domain
MWESGKRSPDLRTAKQVADFFGVTVDYLFGVDYDSEKTIHPGSDSLGVFPEDESCSDLSELIDAARQLDADGMKTAISLIHEILKDGTSEGGTI